MGEPIAKSIHNLRDEHSITSTYVLIVDDDPQVLSTISRILSRAGYEPIPAIDGNEAVHLLENYTFAAILSDINMPGMNGVEFLKKVRRHDLDVPVLLITGDPSVRTAAKAMEFGAFRYLLKPIHPLELTESVRHAIRLHKMANLKRNALEMMGSRNLLLGDKAALEARFSSAMETLWMALQPIVSIGERKIFAYEALLRTEEETLKNPSALILVAERLHKLKELGRSIRSKVANIVKSGPPELKVFINLHSLDLNDEELYELTSPLSFVANQIVLEITERASLDEVNDLVDKVIRLRELGFQIAIDDLGAGYAGLSSFTQLNPEIVKLDMSLIHGIDRDPKKQSVVRSMARLSKELGMLTVAEGVETPRERDTVHQLGCDFLQGYLFSKPMKGIPPVKLGVWGSNGTDSHRRG